MTLSPTAQAVLDLGELSLRFGRVDRVTYHPDGARLESDTDHTVMLGLVACAFAHAERLDLDLGLVAQYAFVHDLIEAYAGDTPTLRISDEIRADKAKREEAAYLRIAQEFAIRLPWLATTIADYELRRTPEARYVKAMDKVLPKLTHVLNGGVTLHEQGMTRDQLEVRYAEQREELLSYAGDIPELIALRDELAAVVLELARTEARL
jgi:putative hydrolases of HD superfamily